MFLDLSVDYSLHCFPVAVPLHDPHSAENVARIEHEVMVLTLRQLVLCLLTRLFPQQAHFVQFKDLLPEVALALVLKPIDDCLEIRAVSLEE